MASNEIEVLDPAASIEKVKNLASERVLNRRHFMAAIGVTGAAAAAGSDLLSGPSAFAQQPKPAGYTQIDVLNFLLQIKYLTGTFYSFLTQGADLPAISSVTLGSGQVYNQPAQISVANWGLNLSASSPTTGQQIADLFNEMYYDELNQLIDLRNLVEAMTPGFVAGQTPVGSTAVAARTTMNLLGTGTTTTATTTLTAPQAIGQARMLEDLSVQAFAGALVYLTGQNLTYATQVLAVDGFHAGALRLISIQTGAPYQGTEQITSFQIGTTVGSNTAYAISTIPTTVLVGQPISGTNIATGSYITALTSTAAKTTTAITVKSSNVLNTVASVSGLVAGQPITGTNIPALTVITAVGTNTITLSQAASASTTVAPTGLLAPPVTFTGNLTSKSPNITNVSSWAGIVVGQPITGTGIPANTVIASIFPVPPATGASAIVMSASATATGTGVTITAPGVNVVGLSSVSGLLVGQALTGTGVPSGATITAVSATNASPLSLTMSAPATALNTVKITGVTTAGSLTITSLSSTSGLVAGQLITDTQGLLPAGTAIISVNAGPPASLSISQPATGTSTNTSTLSFTALPTVGSNQLISVSNTSAPIVGQALTGAGIPAGTTITAFSPANATITMSNAATATTFTTKTGTTTYGSTVITGASSISGLVANQPITGQGIPAGTLIVSTSGTTVTLSNAITTISFTGTTTSGSAAVTAVSSIVGLATGMTVSGTGIPSGATITAVATGTVTLSANATASGTGTLVAGNPTGTTSISFTSPTTITITSPSGEQLTTVTTVAVTSPTNETITVGQSSITMSLPAVATGSTTALTILADPLDVAPGDPGSASAAAAGPAANSASSPPVYQGFFNTAGQANGNGSVPPGFAFTRTFGQVLSVLYAYNSASAQDYEGGFYPVGVSGNINAIT